MGNKKLRGIAKIMDWEKEVLLEYYMTKNNNFYGFEIDESMKVENDELKLCETYVSNYNVENQEEANNILDVFIRNSVTPVTAESVLQDMKYKK